ncbi:MAG: bifunctional 4-hydroxy-2-oxoglutarate aldolase/2-dehydro-3-deoxy-phosphogluconate aldolase [Bacilli bacterium]|nr:bifunctional 4-hydroxy-2-oxoglutarate aldolase/2-dehydro-3-deoxy-phosphogluconate aldolase [Bacilli bacterium]
MKLDDFKVIPVVVLNDEEDCKAKMQGLIEGKLPVAEITFRTAYAYEGIKYAIKHYPEVIVGAGTVINKEQCEKALEAGCKFIVSPGLSEEVALICKERGVPYFPGCVTPTEIIKAISLGITTIKFFPAQVYGGLKAIDALGAAFPQVKFLPTGGANASNLKEYLTNPRIKAVGGSWMMKGDVKANCLEIDAIVKSL